MDNFLESFRQIDRRFKLIFFLIMALCLGLAIYLTRLTQKPDYQINIHPDLNTNIDINLDRFSITTTPNIIKDQDLASKIEFIPNVNFATSFSSNQLIIKPQQILRDNTKYTLRIANINLENNGFIGLREFKFTAKELTRQESSAIEQKSASQVKDQFPLLSKLPIYDTEYKITFSLADPKKPTIIITTLAPLNRPEQFEEYLVRSKEIRGLATTRLNEIQADWQNFYNVEFDPSDLELDR